MPEAAADRYDRAAAQALTGRRAQRGRESDIETAVLDAAEELLAEVRLYDLKVMDIIERAGTSRATFYFYFSSKFAVVAAVLTRSVDEIFEAVQPWVAEQDDAPGERLNRSLVAAGELWMKHRHVLCSVSESWPLVEELEELWLAVMGRFVDAFTESVAQDTAAGLTVVEGDPRELVASLVWGSERVFYVASRDAEVSLGGMDAAVRQLQCVWGSTIYGTASAGSR